MRKVQECAIEGVPGEGIFVTVDGVRIASRGPKHTWIPMKSGWRVLDVDDNVTNGIVIERTSTSIH